MKRIKWTQNEIVQLRVLARTQTFKQLSKSLDRSYNAIRLMASKLKLPSLYDPAKETQKQEIRVKIANTLKRLGLKPPSPLGRKHTSRTKRIMSLVHKGDRNSVWKGDKVGYYGLHSWVRKWKGSSDICEFCSKSGLSGKQIHWANKSGLYKRNLDDWIRLCINCHTEYDKRWIKRIRNKKGQFSSCKTKS